MAQTLAEVKRVPVNHDGGKEVQAGYAEMLALQCHLALSRNRPGIAAAKQRGTYRGRLPGIDMEAVKHRLAMGLSSTAIARELGISRGTVYKAKADIA